MSLKPWREIIVPHPDVLNGTFQQSESAAAGMPVNPLTSNCQDFKTTLTPKKK